METPHFEFYRSSAADPGVVNIPALGLELSVRLPPSASGRSMCIIETKNAPGFGPPLHRHRETEIFRVLEGRYLYEVDGERFEAVEGDVVSVPGGAAHAFLNIGDTSARQLVILVPGMDAEAFFTGLAAVLAKGRPGRDELNAFGKPWGVEFLGPPLSSSPRQPA